MKLVLVFLVFLASGFGNGDEARLVERPFEVTKVTLEGLRVDGPTTRIFGGKEAEAGRYTYMVLVLMRNKNGDLYKCSGSLAGKNWVLLAAHCIQDDMKANDFILAGGTPRLGEYLKTRLEKPFEETVNVINVQERRVSAFYVHPDFDKENKNYDLALLKLKTPFGADMKAQNVSKSKPTKKENCMVLGWGLHPRNEFDGVLRYFDNVNVNTPMYGCLNKPLGPFLCLRDSGVNGICDGDAGGPLVCDDLTWGVASHYFSYEAHPLCGDSEETYFSDLYSSGEWLESYLNHGNPSGGRTAKTFVGIIVTLFLVFMTY